MRIGFDAKRAFLNFTGLGNYSRTIIKNLALLYPEHDYYLFTPKISDNFRSFPPSGVSVIEPEKIIDRISGSYWRSFKMGSDINFHKINVFHGLSNELPRNLNKYGAKSVVTIHDLIFMRFPELYNKIDLIFYKNKFRAAGKMADKIIAISEQTRRDLISFFDIDPGKIEVIYQGCDPVFYQKSGPEEKEQIRLKYKLPDNYILYVGTIEERKNLLQLIRAKNEYGIKIPLVAIGRPTHYMKKILEYINKSNINDVFFPGQVSYKDLPAIYQMSSLFVYPSSFEGFGIPILEALNSGTPVIASSGSCLEETGGPGSIYINPDNVSEIASAIQKVLKNETLRKSMIKEGFKHALNFREDKSIRTIMDLYQKLV